MGAGHFTFRDNRIIVKVDRSASFLQFPFESITNIERVRFDWKSEGEPEQPFLN